MNLANLGICLGMVTPIYNLVIVAIVIALFFKLFSLKNKKNKKIYLLPWKLLFFAILVYIIEEVLTVLAIIFRFSIPKLVAPLMEMVIISSFIYLLLLQKEYVRGLR